VTRTPRPSRRPARAALLGAAALALLAPLAACSNDGGGGSAPNRTADASRSPDPSPSSTDSPSPATSPATSPSGSPTGERRSTPHVAGVVAGGLQAPWGLAFLPGGDALVTERDTGRLLRVSAEGEVDDLGTVPGVVASGEGGLLGLAVSPDFSADQLVYVYVTGAEDNRIVRMQLRGGSLGDPEPVLTGIPSGGIHNGGRLVFGPDGLLYASTGEVGETGLSQDRGSLGGKILRMTPDGDVPTDNPFADSLVWSLGHRNVQGLTFDEQGRLWASEFGQNTWDELNLIRKGANYGWPVCEGRCGDNEYVDPVAQWTPDEASPSGVAYADGAVYMAGLRGARLWQIPVDGARAGRPRDFLTGRYGRLRTVVLAPDGSLWLTTSNRDGRGQPNANDDRILRVELR